MCGIAGIIGLNHSLNEKHINKINTIVEKITHRGPNQKITKKINENNYIGFVRLSIIDLTDNSNQPIVSDNKKISLIYNGEIYNYLDLKKTYFNDLTFKSNGDGEVLLKMYEKFGIEFINKIKGMFSISIIDNSKKTTYLIRDRFGIKPLYYFKNNNFLYYCSEIKGLIASNEIKREINFDEAKIYLNNGLINSNHQTWFKNIFQVKPGSYMEINDDKVVEKKYYELKNNIDEDYHDKGDISFKSYANSLKELFDNSLIQHSKLSDVPVGLHLSGGIDSTVLASACKRNSININSYTFGFEHKEFSEEKTAKEISDAAGIKNFTAILNDKDLSSKLFKTIETEYEPFSSLRIVSNHYLYEKYKDCKVILDGAGGDEIASGYTYHVLPWMMDLIKECDSKKLLHRFRKLISKVNNNNQIENDSFIFGSIGQYMFPGFSTVDGSHISKKSIFEFENENYFQKIEPQNNNFKSHLRNAQYNDLMHFKLPRALRYVDRASMINSTETRVPFLDHEVVELCFSLPSRYKYINDNHRFIFKYISKQEQFKKFLNKNKRTIADPQTKWLKTTLKELVNDTLLSTSFSSKDLINHKKLKKYVNDFMNDSSMKNSYLIFQILNMELWRKNILNA